MFSISGDVQYIGGYHKYIGDIMSTLGVFSTLGGTMSRSRDVQYIGGYNEYISGYHEYIGGFYDACRRES